MAIEVEKLHVSLTASTSDYKKNIEDAMSVTDALVSKVKMAMRSLNTVTGKIGMNVDTSGATQSLDELARKLDETHAKIVEKSREIEQAKKAMSGTFKHFGIDNTSAQPGLQYIAQLQKEYDELYQQANKYAEAMERVSRNEPTKEEKAGMSALSKEMDTLLQKLTAFNEKLTTGKATIKEMVTDAKELSKQFGSAASAAQTLSKAKVSTKALTQTDSTPKAAAMPKIEPVKQKHVSMIDRARKAMDRLARSSKKASGSFHGESFMKKLRNFTKSMIIFRTIFYIMSKLGEAMQAAAQHSDRTQSALNSAKSASTNLVNSFAVILLPVLKAIAPLLESITRKFVDMANIVAQFMAALLGQKTYQKAIYASEQWGDSTAGAIDQVAKAQKSIMGFDELNVLQDPKASSGGGSQGPIAGGGLGEEVAVDNKFFEATKGIRDFIGEIKKGVERIADVYMKKIHPHVKKLIEPTRRVAGLIGDVIVGALGWIGDFLDGGGANGIEIFIETLGKLLELIGNVGRAISKLDAWLKEKGINIGLSAEDIGAKFEKLATAIYNVVDGLNDLFEGDFDGGFKVLEGLIKLFDFDKVLRFFEELKKADGGEETFGVGLKTMMSDPLGSMKFGPILSQLFGLKLVIGGVITFLEELERQFEIARTNITNNWELFGKVIKGVWGDVKSWWVDRFNEIKQSYEDTGNIIRGAFSGIPQYFREKFESAKRTVGEKFDGMKISASNTFTSIKNFFSNIPDSFSERFRLAKIKVSGWFNGMKNDASNTDSGIKKFFSNTPNWFGGRFSQAKAQVALKFGEMKNKAFIAWLNIQSVFSNVKTWFGNKFGGASDSIVTKFSGLGEKLKKPFNSAITVINRFIRRLNNLNINIPSIMGGGKIGFSIPTITPLATGTVVQPNKPFLAELGDNKREPEIVSPLSTMKQAIREVQDERGGSNSNQDISIAVYVGNDKLVDRTIKGANERALQSGKLILNV